MFAFPSMLVPAAEEAGMKVPPDADQFDNPEYPHFAVFCAMQLGQPFPYAGVVWDNAKVIAEIPDDRIMQVTHNDLDEAGFAVGYPLP